MALALIACHELADAEVVLDSTPLPNGPLRHPGVRTNCLARAELHLARGEAQRALDLLDKLTSSAPNVATGGVIPRLWRTRADCLITLRRTDEAEVLLNEASRVAREQGLLHNLWRSEVALGKLFH